MNIKYASISDKLSDAAHSLYLRWLVARAFRPPHDGRIRTLLRSAATLGGAVLVPAMLLVCILMAVVLSLAGRGLARL